jgi:hypothetical protein
MKDTKGTKIERILEEVRLQKMEYYKRRFEPKVVIPEKRVMVDLPIRSFEIVLNGENICSVQFGEVQKKLDQIFNDFKTLQIEGFQFVFENRKWNFIVNTFSK